MSEKIYVLNGNLCDTSGPRRPTTGKEGQGHKANYFNPSSIWPCRLMSLQSILEPIIKLPGRQWRLGFSVSTGIKVEAWLPICRHQPDGTSGADTSLQVQQDVRCCSSHIPRYHNNSSEKTSSSTSPAPPSLVTPSSTAMERTELAAPEPN